MERYSEYKDSGVKWLGEIPSHWEVVRGLAVFSENKNKNTQLENSIVLSLSYGKIIVKKDIDSGLVPEEYSSYQIVKPGFIIVRSTDLQNDKTSLRIGYVCNEGIITSAYLGLQVKGNNNDKYLYYFLHDWDITKEIYRHGNGLRQSLSWNDLRDVNVLLPPLSEQDAIVRYLDSATSKIDKAIAMQQKMIDLLNERKQIIVQNAVTKGLDENVEMKDSGVEWIGMIPKHWGLYPLRKYLNVNSKRNMPNAQLLSVTREEGVIVRNTESKEENHNFIPDDLSNYKYVRKGQFVINKMKSWQGSYGVSNFNGIVSPAYFVYDLNYPNTTYFSMAIRSKMFSPFFSKYSKGIRIDQWDLVPEALKVIPFLEPPVEEQIEIVEYLGNLIPKIESKISNCQRQIALLQERKQIIINEVVTGKVKVS